MNEIKATMTSKGQITIPLKIREKLDINTGDIITFVINEDGTILMKKGEVKCPICHGEKEIQSKLCFACDGTGAFQYKKSVAYACGDIAKYKISASIIQHEMKDNVPVLRKYPLVRLSSNEYPVDSISLYQDILQEKIIFENGCENTKITEEELENLYVSEYGKKLIQRNLNPLMGIFEDLFKI